jgi:hypothetical protein
VHRAAGLEPVQARDLVGRLPPDQPLPRRRAQSARALDRGGTHAPQDGRGLRSGAHGGARVAPRGVPDGVGDPDAVARRHGGRSRSLHRSEPVAEPLHREPEHRPALEHVLLRLEEGPATRIAKATVETPTHVASDPAGNPHAATGWTPPPPPADDAAAVACSLENPETCEACQ